MWKIIVVGFALCVCAMSQYGFLTINWNCSSHIRITNNLTSLVIDEYRITHGGGPKYVIDFVEFNNKKYYSYLELYGGMEWAEPVLLVTNETGVCQEIVDPSIADPMAIYTSAFGYTGDPEEVTCPDGTTGCKKFCGSTESATPNPEMCIILDTSSRLVEVDSLLSPVAVYYTHLDYTPPADMFTVQCQGDTYTVTDYCAPPKVLGLNMDCSFHVKMKTEESVRDSYWILYGKKVAYVYNDVVSPDNHYYEVLYFSDKRYFFRVLTNQSGECVDEGLQYQMLYFTEFSYYKEPEEVKCPGDGRDCFKYCNDELNAGSEECIVVDSKQRMISYSYFGETTEFTYYDDIPNLDMFNLECEGTEFSAFDSCAPSKKVDLNMDCVGHVQCNGEDIYWMYDGDFLSTIRLTSVFTVVKVTMFLYFDLEKRDRSGTSVVVSTDGSMCMASSMSNPNMDSVTGLFWSSSFEYFGEPQQVKCRGGVSDCNAYCNNVTQVCIMVDPSMRLMGIGDLHDMNEFTYLDIPTVDDFTAECQGNNYTTTDTCAEHSSSQSSESSHGSASSPSSHGSPSSPVSPSSTPNAVSSASIKKAAIIFVFAAVVASLL